MGRPSSMILLLVVSLLAIESRANSLPQNVAPDVCKDLEDMEFEQICNSLGLDQRCAKDSDCDQGDGGICCPQLQLLLEATVPADQTISKCGICAPLNHTCCDVLFIGATSGGTECQIYQASCPSLLPHCQPPPKFSTKSNKKGIFDNLKDTPLYFLNTPVVSFYQTMADWCSSNSPCDSVEGGLCKCGKCSDTNLGNPCFACGSSGCSTFDGNVSTDTAIVGFIALGSLLGISSYFLILWLWKRRDAPFPAPYDVMSNTDRIWRLVTIYNPIYFANFFIFYGKDFAFLSRVVTILIFQILLGFTIAGMYSSKDEANKECPDDISENVARVFSVAVIIPVWQYFFNTYVMKPKLVADESLFSDKGRWFNVPYLSFVFYGAIVLGGLATTIVSAVFTNDRDLVIRWASGLTIITFVVSPLIGLASGFLLKEFDEKSDVQAISSKPGAGRKSAQPDKPDPSITSDTQSIATGLPKAENDPWRSQSTQAQAPRPRDDPKPPAQNASNRFQRPPPPREEKTDNPFASSDNPFA